MWVVVAVALLEACGSEPAPDRLRIGEAFPSIVLVDLDGERTPIEAYRGRAVLLNVWATWCAPCRRELPSLQRLSERIDPQDLTVALLSVDDDDYVVREYLIDKKVTLQSYIDTNMAIADKQLGITAYPATFLIGPDGVLLRRFIGERDWDAPTMARSLIVSAPGESAR